MVERDDWLWDRSGERDPEVERLEALLRPLGHDGRPLAADGAAAGPPAERPFWREPRLLLAAACLAVAAGIVTLASRPAPERAGWSVARLEGAPRIGLWRFGAEAKLEEGQTLVTDERSRARIEVGAIGEVTLEPRSRLRLVRAHEGDHRLALERGVLHALIVAPPRRFTVETPAVTTVDLGCAYTLEVDRAGRSVVSVQSGWVSFERGGHESFIPAGARCVTERGRNPGTPHYLDAEPRLIAALETLDAAPPGAADTGALDRVLAAARRADALTLWHLLARQGGGERERVYARLARLAPPPAGVTREAVLAGDRVALDLWWNSLGLGDVEWWRLWAQDPPRG